MPWRVERSEAPFPERESGLVPPDALLLVLATLLLIALALGVAVVRWICTAVPPRPRRLGPGRGALAALPGRSGRDFARLFLWTSTIGVCERTHKVSSVTP
ncbi:hypothetical protein GCM10009839_92430 [Catenulispora yoronensis]|uniref:Uncharacterized protein n=1 Tax=Catenulispora yoronensis TaxID=450799 RepID=A0ABP5H6S9_9ACTN